MLNQNQISQLRSLYSSRTYETLLELRKNMIVNWSQPSAGETQWKYIRNSLERDYKISGITWFLEEIERLSNQELTK